LVLILVLTLAGCKDSPSSNNPTPPHAEKPSDKNKFVWDAMNYWYFWQDEVPKLADSFEEETDEFRGFLNSYTGSEAAKDLFGDLQYKDDRFSFFVDDYEEYLEARKGIHAAMGFNYGFIGFENSNKIVGYAGYVIPDSPAEKAGLERLDLFTKVDGTALNGSNYAELLTDDKAHELTMAHIVEHSDGSISFQEDSTITVASDRVDENPVFKYKVIDNNGSKIGYLVYNAFQRDSHKELNNVFEKFKSENIDQLVLDLRYNGGGAVITSQVLASLIANEGCSAVFANYKYNPKRTDQDKVLYFFDEVPIQDEDEEFIYKDHNNWNKCLDYSNTEPMNHLSLNQLYVLVSNSTASASEALINGLRPYIDITIIGTETVGKDQAALLLFDAPEPYTDEEQANDDKKAIQPIIAKFKNADDNGYPHSAQIEVSNNEVINYHNFKPKEENKVDEITPVNLQRKPLLGDPDEPLLARAIALITGQPAKSRMSFRSVGSVMHKLKTRNGIQQLRPHGNNMYIEPSIVPNKKD